MHAFNGSNNPTFCSSYKSKAIIFWSCYPNNSGNNDNFIPRHKQLHLRLVMVFLNLVLPVGLAVLSAVAVSVFTTRRTYKREKRIEAKYGHHKQLNQALTELRARFKECKCSPDCNPFCMKYRDDVILGNGLLEIPLGDREKCKTAFLLLADRINKLISEQDVNINPTSISLEEWTNSQQTLREFTQLIIENWGADTVDSNTGIHRNNWNTLQTAIRTIVDSTDYTRYR